MIWLLIGICAIYVGYSYVLSYWRLRHIPGPTFAAWSSIPYVLNTISGELHKRQYSICEKYGSLVRIGPDTLVTSDPELIRDMNGVRSTFGKSGWYKAFRLDADKDNLVSVLDDDVHMAMRNKLASGYAGKDSLNREKHVDEVMLSLVQLIDQKYVSDGTNLKPVDWALLAQYLTLDVITKLGLGEQFGWVKDDEDKFDYVKTWTANIPVVSFLSSVPWFIKLMTHPSIQPYLVPSVKERAGLGAVKAAARDRIVQRFGEKGEDGSINTGRTDNQDMIQSFIDQGLTLTEVADESLLGIVAGSDTTASTIRTAVLYIISNPSVYHKLQAECDATTAAYNLTHDRIISYTQATQLPYLTACINEALRIRTPTAGMLPRVVPKEGYLHKKTNLFIPGGTTIGMSMSNVSYDRTIYGDDVTSFRPERWLVSSPPTATKNHTTTNDTHKDLDKMQKQIDLTFGYGKHRCLGERIAKMEIHKVVFELFRRYDLNFIDAAKPIAWEANYGLWYMSGMFLRVEDRRKF